MHFDCACLTVSEWAKKHEKCTHPKSCLFIKTKAKKKQHA